MAGSQRDERALVRGAQRGSVSDLEALFRRHWPRAYRAAYLVVHDSAAAEDIAQEAFLAAVRSLDRFDRRRPFGPWLHRIVVNRAIDYARARELRREVAGDRVDRAAPDAAAGPSDEVVAALAALPPDQRAVIVMRHLLGFTPGVIALAFAAVLAGAAVAVAADSPRWVRSVLGTAQSPHPVRVSLGSLPAGRLLVSSSRGTWIVRGDGTRVRLGPWTAATWSPRGLYVAAWRGHELSAVAPDGRVAWTFAAPAAVRDARWSPDGYRIAYRRASGLAVVAGDGTGPRILAAAVRAVAPAWRPGEPHTLAWVGARGRVEVRDVDTGRVDWRWATPVGAVRELLWSADGRRLLVRGERRLVVFEVGASEAARSGRGRATARNGHTLDLPRGARVTAAAWAPRGRRLAIALRTGTTSRVVLTGSASIPPPPPLPAPC